MERNEEIQSEEIQNEKVQNAVTETGRSKKKLLIILISAAAVVLIAAAVFAIVKLNTQNNSDKNELISEQTDPEKDKDETNDETDDTDESAAVEGENTEDGTEDTDDKQDDTLAADAETLAAEKEAAREAIISDLKDGNYNYTKEQLIDVGFTECDLSGIDINSNILEEGKTISSMLDDVTDADIADPNCEDYYCFSYDDVSKIKVGENNYTVYFPALTDYFNNVYEEINIENVRKMYFRPGEAAHVYYILTNDNVLVTVQSYSGYFDNSEGWKRYKYYSLSDDYVEMFDVYSHPYTEGCHSTAIGLTVSGEYKYIYSGCPFYNDYYFQDINFQILNNRDIYANGVKYGAKYLSEISGEYESIAYIIDENMNLIKVSVYTDSDILTDTGIDVAAELFYHREGYSGGTYALFDSTGKLVKAIETF